jgi:hypothetical protein
MKIDKKIVGYKVASPSSPIEQPKQVMHEAVERPEHLRGCTYKLKTPLSDHSIYLTINDVVLNAGTDHEAFHPYEIFINSKEMEYYQWVTALTRVISAVFRKGGDVEFLIEELKTVADPKGSFWYKGKQFGSIVALIGATIETHLERNAK